MKTYRNTTRNNFPRYSRYGILLLILVALVYLTSCVSQKKYNSALDEIARLKVDQYVETYDKADLAYSKDNKIFDLKAELIEEQRKSDSLQRHLTISQSEIDTMHVWLSRLNTGPTGFIQGINEIDEKVIIKLNNDILFPIGSSELNESGKGAATTLSEGIKKLNDKWNVWVIGYTDNQPYSKSVNSNNWQLSVDRAMAFAGELIDNDVPGNLIWVAGRSKFSPDAPNQSASGKAANRRTEIILIPKISDREAF